MIHHQGLPGLVCVSVSHKKCPGQARPAPHIHCSFLSPGQGLTHPRLRRLVMLSLLCFQKQAQERFCNSRCSQDTGRGREMLCTVLWFLVSDQLKVTIEASDWLVMTPSLVWAPNKGLANYMTLPNITHSFNNNHQPMTQLSPIRANITLYWHHYVQCRQHE